MKEQITVNDLTTAELEGFMKKVQSEIKSLEGKRRPNKEKILRLMLERIGIAHEIKDRKAAKQNSFKKD